MGAANKETVLSFPNEREIVVVREVDAPVRLVWRAWTEPEHLGRWWGPTGFTNTTYRMEFRPGGVWKYDMHGPDGRVYPNEIMYSEIETHRRIVFRHTGSAGTEPVHFQTSATFEEIDAGRRTRVTLRSEFVSQEARDFVIREYGAAEGGKQTLARLDAYASGLERGDGSTGLFEIQRVVRATPERVWAAWADPDQIMRWFGPRGTTMPRPTIELRPGGRLHYCMRFEGGEHWGVWTFREVREPALMESVVSFADASGWPARAPHNPLWPMEVLSRVTIEPHAGFGRGTVVTVRWEPINATEEERRVFVAGDAEMRTGWSGTLDRLEEVCEGGLEVNRR